MVEADWEQLSDVIAQLAATRAVRVAVLEAVAADESHRQARVRWAEWRVARLG